MKLMWLCNMMPGAVKEKNGGAADGGLWVDHVLSDLRRTDLVLHILCPGPKAKGSLDEKRSFSTFQEGRPYIYLPELEEAFRQEVQDFAPDVIHIWGTEYGHTLAMVNACEKLGCLNRVAISIQGLCSVYADHYSEGIPEKVRHSYTFRDFVRQDNIRQQQEVFAKRGALEVQALQKVKHIIGRTCWDKACAERIQPGAQYHFCNETLREPFYQDRWYYADCRKHRIFASSYYCPVKGFHYLLEAAAMLRPEFPDLSIAVTGPDILDSKDLEKKIRRSSYPKYLAKQIRKYGLEDSVEFLGSLSARQMKAEYLKAHVFAMPSTIENSPNSLGEAMLLGTPCVASHVGGISTMLQHEAEGYLYQSTAAYMLAHYIRKVFRMEEQAEELGRRAADHASRTHDPDTNWQTLRAIYETVNADGRKDNG